MSAIGKIAKGAKNILLGRDLDFNAGAKAIKDFSIEKVKKGSENSFYQHMVPYRLSGKVGATGAAVVGGIGILNTMGDSRGTASMGKMSYDGASMSGMTDKVKLSQKIQDVQEGKPVALSNSHKNDGAEGDLVFALHNMR